MPLVSISAKDIDTAGLKVETDIPADWINRELAETEATAKSAGRLAARLSKSGNHVVVRGEATATVTMPCARCLNPASVDLNGELSLLLQPDPSARHAGGRGHEKEKAGAGGAGSGGGSGSGGDASMWARAAAKAIPEWGATSQGKADAGKGGKAGAGSSKSSSASNANKESRKAKEPEYEFGAEEAEIDTYDGETVVLDDFIREALLLELPNFPLCSEACPGIRPAEPAPGAQTGAPSEQVDPRLAPLGALRAKLAKPQAMNGPGPAPAAKSAAKAPGKKAKQAKQASEAAGEPKSKSKKTTKKSNKE